MGFFDHLSTRVEVTPRESRWILARAPELDWERQSLALATASANGYDVSRLAED